MVDLPTPIKKQLADIDKLYEQPAPAEAAVEGEPAAATETPEPAPSGENVAQAESPSQAPAPEATSPAPAPAQEDPVWEKRYKTLQGLHNQNMADLKGRLQARDSELATLRKEVEELKKAKPAPTVDPKDAEAFGEDLIAMVQRVVEAKLGHSGAQAESRIADLETRLEGTRNVAAQTAEGLFIQNLAVQVPDYETLNFDQGFLDWLAQMDEVYGEPRQAALDRAVNALDAVRVARVFNAYKATLAPPVQQPAAPAKPSPQSQLERQVAPRASSSPAAQAPEPQRTYTASEVTKFYDDVSKGRYAGRQEEMIRKEAAINAALAEGRIA